MSFKKKVETLSRVIGFVADLTPTKIDDQIVEFLEAITASDDLMAWFERLLGRSVLGEREILAPPERFEMNKGEKAGRANAESLMSSIDLTKVQKWIPVLIQLFKLLK